MTGKTPSLLFGIGRASLTNPEEENKTLPICESRAEEENPAAENECLVSVETSTVQIPPFVLQRKATHT